MPEDNTAWRKELPPGLNIGLGWKRDEKGNVTYELGATYQGPDDEQPHPISAVHLGSELSTRSARRERQLLAAAIFKRIQKDLAAEQLKEWSADEFSDWMEGLTPKDAKELPRAQIP